MLKLNCLLICLALLAGTAQADSPAAIPDSGRDRAGISFDVFAAKWMQRARATELASRENPNVAPGSVSPLVTFRGYGEDYDLELRPTGNPNAPYVGLLRYVENVYSCSSIEAAECAVVSSVPVTEIFRYSEGRWRY